MATKSLPTEWVACEKSALLILAAGQSSRMGFPKGLADWHGRPWLLEILERAKSFNFISDIYVVLGAHADAYEDKIPSLTKRALCVRNPKPERGSFSSLQCGLRAYDQTSLASSVFVLPVDHAWPTAATWQTLRDALLPKVCAAWPRFEEQGGHPVLLQRSFAVELLSKDPVHPDSRLDVQTQRLFPDEIRRPLVPDASVLRSFNTPEEWNAFLASDSAGSSVLSPLSVQSEAE